MQIRIYRANNAFHIATIAPHVSVASLTPALNERLLQGKDVEMHRLYLKERGRGGWSFLCSILCMLIVGFSCTERILGQTERPADIVRRRVEQAGYDQSDAADLLNSDLSFILKFVYKSQLLGPTVSLP
jgi:adenylate cyclase